MLLIFILCSTLHSPKVKKIIGNVTAKSYLKESLLSILCFIIQGKGSSGRGLILKFYFVADGNLTRLGFLFSRIH